MAELNKTFREKKARILQSLLRPDKEYKDLSPKGSVDEGIRKLIDLINGLDGLVTTSSCAGRISVFLEGKKGPTTQTSGEEIASTEHVVSGGKGLGGRWLFVSHERVDADSSEHSLFELFGLPKKSDSRLRIGTANPRLVKFQFEPMVMVSSHSRGLRLSFPQILHVMAASLHHARIVLAAAIAAGFRESGLQSLKALTCPDALPTVAVRTAGLSLSSVIACLAGPDQIEMLVDESYLKILVQEANERVHANAVRIGRFENSLIAQGKQQPAGSTISQNKDGKHGPTARPRGHSNDLQKNPRDQRRLSDVLEDSLGIFDCT